MKEMPRGCWPLGGLMDPRAVEPQEEALPRELPWENEAIVHLLLWVLGTALHVL